MSDQLAGAMETVARALLGEPNKAMSKKTELRFGRQGSVSVDLSKGVFHDHENDAKGGGSIYTCAFSEGETRPQEMHSATRYQEETAQPGQKPKFYAYTDLTEARGEVR